MKAIYKALICLLYWGLTAIQNGRPMCTHGDVRLTGGPRRIVEACYINKWRPVCNDEHWDDTDAKVLCRQLGMPHTGATADVNSNGTVIITEVRCSGSEQGLLDCRYTTGDMCAGLAKANCTNATACANGDIRLRGKHSNSTAISAGLDVCVDGRWRTVCRNDAWNSNTARNENARVACRQLGYNKKGAINQAINESTITREGTTSLGLRQDNCNGDEQHLIDCPKQNNINHCMTRAFLTCTIVPCSTTIRLGGGSTATEGRVEVCRDGQWGTVCDHSWDKNDASVACRELGLSDSNAVAVTTATFGPGSGRIHLSNPQCTGSEATLADCTFNTAHQCTHNQDASVICQPNTDECQCTSRQIRIAYESELTSLEVCINELWKMCTNTEPCSHITVAQHATYICGEDVHHSFVARNQQYNCTISETSNLLLCTITHANTFSNCIQVLQNINLQASFSSITVTWGNAEYSTSTNIEQEISCSPHTSLLKYSIIVDAAASEFIVENLPHSTTYECCVTLHIGRYSTRACNNTATLADTTELPHNTATTQPSTADAIQGAGLWVIIALGVLVAVLVLVLVLVTAACLCLLVSRNTNGKAKMAIQSTKGDSHSTAELYLDNPNYSLHELPTLTLPPPPPNAPRPTLPPPPVTSHTLPLASPSPTLTPPFPTEELFNDPEYSVIKAPKKTEEMNGTKIGEADFDPYQMPTYEVPVVTNESPPPTQDRVLEEYSHLQH